MWTPPSWVPPTGVSITGASTKKARLTEPGLLRAAAVAVALALTQGQNVTSSPSVWFVPAPPSPGSRNQNW